MRLRGMWSISAASTSATLLALALFAAACSDTDGDPTSTEAAVASSMTVTTAPPVLSVPVFTTSTTTVSTTSSFATATTVPASTTVAGPTFVSRVVAIDAALAARMRTSWHEGCPVGLADLRYATVSYWGFDDAPHDGELVLNAAHAEAIVGVFAALFDARFPIERMRLVDDYGGDDKASMRANNTSAFNCRDVDGRPGVLSAHSWGTAIDVNPLVNPWVRGNDVDPPEGAPYADRNQPIRGGIFAGDVVVQAFRVIGWAWGGAWPTSKDFQHFSASGN